MCWTHNLKVLVAPVPQNRRGGAISESILGIFLFMQAVWHLSLIRGLAGCPHNTMLSLTTHFQPSPTWTWAWLPPTGRICSIIQLWVQLMRNFLLQRIGWIQEKKMPGDLSNEIVGSRITDPFAVVTENPNISPGNAARAATASQDQPPKANGMQASEGGVS